MALDALCFGAHPDDVELTSGGLAARLAAHGHRVGIVDLTRGELASRGDKATRAREAQAAAEALGVATRVTLGLPDGGLDRRDPAQLEALVECLRTHRPGLVVAPDRHDEHPDHVEASYLVARACYLSGLARYPAGGERFRPERLLFALYRSASPPHLVVDVSTVWERRMAALRAHASQLDPAAGPGTYLTAPGFEATVEARARAWGALAGVDYAEGYRVRGPLAVLDARALLAARGSAHA
ncbi:MAG TPA: bacillithiol biosynthesis deacetylase BshB1 [Candidatus Eisenbacteria bacterium]|jgi:bacillithiol biosynthesis deacetylase BshB1